MKFSRRHACLGMAALVYPYISTRKYLEFSTAAKVTAALIEEDTEYGSESEIEGFFQRLEITWEALCSRMEAQARVLAPSISFRDYAQPLLLQPDLWESSRRSDRRGIEQGSGRCTEMGVRNACQRTLS